MMLIGIILLAILPCVLGLDRIVGVGGLYEGNELIQKAFERAITEVNVDRVKNLELPRCWMEKEAINVSRDPFEVAEEVCSLMDSGVVAIFGPEDKATVKHVQSMCDEMEVPHITARWDPAQVRSKFFFNLYPYSHSLSKVVPFLIDELNWSTFTILYENTDSLIRLNEVLKMRGPEDPTVTIRQLKNGTNYIHILQEVKYSMDTRIVIDCSIEILPEVLKQAQQVGIMSDEHEYIISSLDLQTIDLEPYQYSGVTITGIRLIDPENENVKSIFEKKLADPWGVDEVSQLPVEAALTYDAVRVFSRALAQFERASDKTISINLCTKRMGWEAGSSLSNFIGQQEVDGLTGLIKFDTAGFRSDFNLDIVGLSQEGLRKIGSWNSIIGKEYLEIFDEIDEGNSIRSKNFIVLIALTKPYGMIKNTSEPMEGNDQYEGFAVDIISAISKQLGFSYTFEVEQDYGSRNEIDGKWSGMIGKLMNRTATLAITDLTITAERMTAVDFTPPFMNLGISILYLKPKKSIPSLFSFLSPFSKEVWLNLIGAYILVSLLLWVIGRLCPAEWNNPYPCIEEPEELENQFNLKNSLWFTIGSIMQQGSEIAPIGISTRMMAGCWWFFCLIIVSSYTANLAAFLTIETPAETIKNVEELAAHTGTIKYGAKDGGSTDKFFKYSSYPTYKKMYKFMSENRADVLTGSNEIGLKKVLDGGYAFLAESSTIHYMEERYCDVVQVGGLLDDKGYGIGMPKNFKYHNQMSTAVLTLHESGELVRLEEKWWKQKDGGGQCEEAATQDATELTVDNVGGVFLVLIIGIVLSCVYTAWELFWDIGCTTCKDKGSFRKELKEELKFIVKCSESTKPARRRKAESSSHSEENSTRGCTPPYGFVPTVITTVHESN